MRARRRSRRDAIALARQYMVSFPLLMTSAEAVDLGLPLFERYPALGAFDAVLAAVALNQRTQALVSADWAFGHVPNLQWVDPGTTSLDLLIGH